MTKEPQAPDPNWQRYSSDSFPPYRFIPGLNPHPVRDPQGHSFGKEHELVQCGDPETWQQEQGYLYGVDLYNHAYWWESHEAWEDLWHTVNKDDVQGQFLQGLIQISAAFIKWHLHQQEGLTRLYDLGLGRLQFVCDHQSKFMGLDLKEHISSLKNHFELVAHGKHDWPQWNHNYPFIRLK